MTQPLTVLYFAWLRERTGLSHEEIALPDGIRTVSALVDHLSARSPGHAAAFQNRRTIRAAVNKEFADPSEPIQPGDEVVFLPWVSGGNGPSTRRQSAGPPPTSRSRSPLTGSPRNGPRARPP